MAASNRNRSNSSNTHNNRPSQPDENPYFDPVVTHEASRTGPTSAAQPTTPAREHPPAVSRPRGFFANGSNNNTVNRQQSSIGLRRLRTRPSRDALNDAAASDGQRNGRLKGQGDAGRAKDGRRRSSSEPQRPTWLTSPNQTQAGEHLPTVQEGSENVPGRQGNSFLSNRSWFPHFPGRQQNRQNDQQQQQQQQQVSPEVAAQQAEYDSRIVDFLDAVDPEVSTLTSITNLQNSLFIPSLGRFVNRRPTYDLSFTPGPVPGGYPSSLQDISEENQTQEQRERPRPGRAFSITSNLEDSHYAVLPHGATLEGWSQEDVDRLNDYVRHMLHSRRSKFKRSMKAFGRYVRRPLGFLVTLYATLITLFGLAWVLFLIGWISIGAKQYYVINVIDYVLVALFAIVGDGLAPFRAVDTYHMIYIAHYRVYTPDSTVSSQQADQPVQIM